MRHLSAFVSLRVQLLLRAAAKETAKPSVTEAQMLQPSHLPPPPTSRPPPLQSPLLPDLSFSSPTLLKGPRCDESQSVQNIPTRAPSPPPRRYLSLWQPTIISASSATSVPACLPLQSISSFQAALSGPKWTSRFGACHNDVNGYRRIEKHLGSHL